MYTIGRFSTICKVPVKTLRYYDEIDLLKPSYIDPQTNYRYYDYEKIEVINIISVLKRLNFSLSEIKECMKDTEQVQWNKIMEQKIIELEKKKVQIINEIEEMKQLKKKWKIDGSMVQSSIFSECFLEDREEILVSTLRKTIKIPYIDSLVTDLFNQVYAFSHKVNGNLMAIFYDRDLQEQKADVELLIPVEDTTELDKCRKIASGTYACMTVQGPYSDLPLGYNRLKKWIMEHKLTLDGNMMEIYEEGLVPTNLNLRHVRPNLSRHPSNFLTTICAPVR